MNISVEEKIGKNHLIVEKVLLFLPVKDIISNESTCKLWNQLITSSIFWMKKCAIDGMSQSLLAEWTELFQKVKNDENMMKECLKLLKVMLVAKSKDIINGCNTFHSPTYMIIHMRKLDDVKKLVTYLDPSWLGSECNLFAHKYEKHSEDPDKKVELFRLLNFPSLTVQLRFENNTFTLLQRSFSFTDEEGKDVTERYRLAKDGSEYFSTLITHKKFPSMES